MNKENPNCYYRCYYCRTRAYVKDLDLHVCDLIHNPDKPRPRHYHQICQVCCDKIRQELGVKNISKYVLTRNQFNAQCARKAQAALGTMTTI
jgi:hypothetical protein